MFSEISLVNLCFLFQFAGNNDEILDLKYFGNNSQYAVVATNSPHIKVFELETWDCEILYGHTDIVLCIDVIQKSDMFLSGGKVSDNDTFFFFNIYGRKDFFYQAT